MQSRPEVTLVTAAAVDFVDQRQVARNQRDTSSNAITIALAASRSPGPGMRIVSIKPRGDLGRRRAAAVIAVSAGTSTAGKGVVRRELGIR